MHMVICQCSTLLYDTQCKAEVSDHVLIVHDSELAYYARVYFNVNA